MSASDSTRAPGLEVALEALAAKLEAPPPAPAPSGSGAARAGARAGAEHIQNEAAACMAAIMCAPHSARVPVGLLVRLLGTLARPGPAQAARARDDAAGGLLLRALSSSGYAREAAGSVAAATALWGAVQRVRAAGWEPGATAVVCSLVLTLLQARGSAGVQHLCSARAEEVVGWLARAVVCFDEWAAVGEDSMTCQAGALTATTYVLDAAPDGGAAALCFVRDTQLVEALGRVAANAGHAPLDGDTLVAVELSAAV